MKYLDFKKTLAPFTTFSLPEIYKIDSSFHRRRLSEWQEKGYIKKLVRGHYMFSDVVVTDNTLFEIANRIYPPSYVSLESALSHYQLIPESVYAVTSISTRKTTRLETPIANFSFRTVRKTLFWGYELVESHAKTLKIASLEKAILDFFYLNPSLQSADDFSSLRLNPERLWTQLDKEKLLSFVDKFAQKRLQQVVIHFLEFMSHA